MLRTQNENFEAFKDVKCYRRKNLIYGIDTRRKYLWGKIEKCLPRLKRCHWQKNSYQVNGLMSPLWDYGVGFLAGLSIQGKLVEKQGQEHGQWYRSLITCWVSEL